MERLGIYKSRFNRKLSPLKVVLIQRKEQLTLEDWKKLVNQTKESILKNPIEYIGADLPPGEILKATIELIFQEFISIESKKR